MTILSNRPIPRTYEMDPKTDDVIRGHRLRLGMVATLEGAINRDYSEKKPKRSEGYSYERFMKTRYWFRIDDIIRRGDIVTIVAEYANGVKRTLTYNEAYFWIVKKDTIPDDFNTPGRMYAE